MTQTVVINGIQDVDYVDILMELVEKGFSVKASRIGEAWEIDATKEIQTINYTYSGSSPTIYTNDNRPVVGGT